MRLRELAYNPTETLKLPSENQAEFILNLSPKRAARREQFKKLGKAIGTLNEYAVRDSQCGLTMPNPWRGMKSDGFQVMQIDTRPGIARKLDENN